MTPKSKALTPEQQKIQELEARINRLEREKAILKKATALLMSDELDRSIPRLSAENSPWNNSSAKHRPRKHQGLCPCHPALRQGVRGQGEKSFPLPYDRRLSLSEVVQGFAPPGTPLATWTTRAA